MKKEVYLQHLSQSSIRPSIFLVRLWNQGRIHSLNQPVLSNKDKVSCWRKQRDLWWGYVIYYSRKRNTMRSNNRSH